MARKPVLLCILDGWGMADPSPYNAITLAKTPHFDALWKNAPRTTLRADGLNVGLPEGQFGNSEVGHTNIGAGRVVMQELPRITLSAKDGSLAANETLAAFAADVKKSGGAVHLMGLVSDGGVHAHQDHIAALARILNARGLKVYIHAFTDGRDTPPQSAIEYIARLEKDIAGSATIATVCGRFYAMDRDNRWERVSAAFQAIVRGEGKAVVSAASALKDSYAAGEHDEFVKPAVIDGYKGFSPEDGLLMANFRSDRAREILRALVKTDFTDFDRGDFQPVKCAAGMVEYADDLNKVMRVLFPPIPMTDIFGEVVARAGLKQLRAAETEKYPHVTFFFNNGREEPFDGESRLMAASPKVATYDLQPEMSAVELTDKLLPLLPENDVVILNYANADMVGHTGSIPAAVKAVETVDTCLGRVAAKIAELGGVLLVTADHGNADQMFDPETNQPHTAHTTNPVPLIVSGYDCTLREGGVLADIIPTMLQILGIPQPAAMTGQSLIVE